MMTMKNTFAILLFALTLVLPTRLFAQTVPSETTASAAMNSTQQTVTLASVSTGTASNWAAGNYLWIENEAMLIRSIPTTGTTVPVIRGQLGTLAAPHKNSAIVYAANGGSFFASSRPLGGPPTQGNSGGASGLYCVRGQWLYMPQIDTVTGNVWSCPKGTSSTWAATNAMPITFNSVSASPF